MKVFCAYLRVDLQNPYKLNEQQTGNEATSGIINSFPISLNPGDSKKEFPAALAADWLKRAFY